MPEDSLLLLRSTGKIPSKQIAFDFVDEFIFKVFAKETCSGYNIHLQVLGLEVHLATQIKEKDLDKYVADRMEELIAKGFRLVLQGRSKSITSNLNFTTASIVEPKATEETKEEGGKVVSGFVIEGSSGDFLNSLLRWHSHSGPEEAHVHPIEKIPQIQAGLESWETKPKRFYCATYTPGKGVEIMGEPIEIA